MMITKRQFLILALYGLLCLPLHATTETHEILSISITPTHPKTIRTYYQKEIESLRDLIGSSADKQGYHWEFPMIADRDLHISLLNFNKGSYNEKHVKELRKLLQEHTGIVPITGHFYRPELWLKKTDTAGKTTYSHFVHAFDQTPTEKDANKQNFDKAMRTTASAEPTEQYDSGFIVLRYGTKGKLAEEMSKVEQDFSIKSKILPIFGSLAKNRVDYESHLIAHLSVARVMRCKSNNRGQQQTITGVNFMDLVSNFEIFRHNLLRKNKPANANQLSIPFATERVELSSGLREKRKVLYALEDKKGKKA